MMRRPSVGRALERLAKSFTTWTPGAQLPLLLKGPRSEADAAKQRPTPARRIAGTRYHARRDP
jgi:hypothetical protein